MKSKNGEFCTTDLFFNFSWYGSYSFRALSCSYENYQNSDGLKVISIESTFWGEEKQLSNSFVKMLQLCIDVDLLFTTV